MPSNSELEASDRCAEQEAETRLMGVDVSISRIRSKGGAETKEKPARKLTSGDMPQSRHAKGRSGRGES